MVVVILALLTAAVTAAVNKSYLDSKTMLVRTVVAAEHIPPYTELSATNLVYREVVRSELPVDAVADLTAFLEKGPLFSGELGFVKGYPLKRSLCLTPDEGALGPALALEQGCSYLGISTDQVRSQMLKPGVLCDAYCYLEGGLNNGPARVISKQEEPLLANLYVAGLRNQDNQEPQGEGREAIAAVVIVETASPEQNKVLIHYQMAGELFLVPVGADAAKFVREKRK